MEENMKRLLVGMFGALLCCGCGGHGGGVDGDGLIDLRGVATLPPQVAAGKVAAANAPFQVIDFERAPAKQLVASGVTDANGVYAVQIVQSKVVAVIVTGAVRVSGLISADESEIGKVADIAKDFDGITDVACQAGVNAISDGSVNPDDFSAERIDNLEAGAALIAAQVNYFDPNSVNAAAEQVRDLTDDGAHAPQ